MKECDIINNAVESIIAESEGNQTEADIMVDSNIQVDPNHKSLPETKIFKKLIIYFPRTHFLVQSEPLYV